MDQTMRAERWMRRRVPTPLMAVLQTAAFPFRHDAANMVSGSPSWNRTKVTRVRAEHFAIKLRGIEFGQGAVFCPPASAFQARDSSPRASPWHSFFRRSVERFTAENAATFDVARTGGLEPPFTTPFTDHRFVSGVGYVRSW